MYGLRMTGPGVLIDGPPIDFNFLFSISPPSYYEDFTISPTGFFVITDAQLLLPLVSREDTQFYFGAGPMFTFTKFSLTIKNTSFDSQELRLGLVGTIGLVQRFGRWAARLDAKYYYEKAGYIGYIFNRPARILVKLDSCLKPPFVPCLYFHLCESLEF